MSKSSDIKHARFNRNNPDERKALEIIERAEASGTTFKDLVLTLILDAEGIVTESPLSVAKELSDTVEEMKEMLSTLQKGGYITQHEPPQKSEPSNAVSLDDALVDSILSQRRKPKRRNK